ERPEDVVDDRVRHLDVGMALDDAPGLEGLERERVHELLERHAVLEALAHRDGEAGQDALQGGAFLGEVDEDLAKGAVVVLAGAEEHLVAPDPGLLVEATTASRQEEPRRLHPRGVCLGGEMPAGMLPQWSLMSSSTAS